MAYSNFLPVVQACAIRVAELDGAGVPNPGTLNLYTCDALTELQVTPVYTDGDEIEQKNACGGICINYKGDDSLKRADVAITVCTPDPYLSAMLGGGDVLTDGGIQGYAYPPIGTLTGDGISIEVWAKRIDDGDLAADYPYMWFVLPKVKNLRHGQRTFNSGAQLPVYSGQALENPNWFDGPLNDWPVASDRILQYFPVDSLPTIDCLPATLAAS